VAAAHDSALRAQAALQRRLVTAALGGLPKAGPPFKPLARSARTDLDRADLTRLAAGTIAAVLGPAYDQQGHNPDLRLARGATLLLTAVDRIDAAGGRLRAVCRLQGVPGEAEAAALQAAEVLALHLGLHLCFADATFAHSTERGTEHAAPAGEQSLELAVADVGLLPRPYLTADARFDAGAPLRVTVTVRERPGVAIGPSEGGEVPAFLGRFNHVGEPALLGEFHLAHAALGDLDIALGPEFAPYRNRRTARLPNGELLLVDRVMALQGRRGVLTGGATAQTEYDSPADGWYYRDGGPMPNCVLMETSLQSAVLLGYFLGPTLADPDEDYSVRNLGGSATVLREVDLRGRTLRQHSQLRSSTLTPGSLLQHFTYELAVDGEAFYRGESLFGYFSAQALANQTGLDGGRTVPPWLETQDPPPTGRTLHVGGEGLLALVDRATVVDGGGRAGLGYLHAVLPVDPSAWYFSRHFHLDPVVPGSLGVEAVLQTLQRWLADSGHADGLRQPEFVLPVGVPLHWRYRGQVLPTDAAATIEVHITGVERRAGRVRVLAEASLWKPGMRIYELDGVAVELREPEAPPW
jgi:3-hydroxymyristoyl/3-hydroxydecanoyl-(acyl carrier protein) dehydratase